MLKKQASELTFTQAQTFSQPLYAIPIAIQRAFSDKGQSAGNCIRGSTP